MNNLRIALMLVTLLAASVVHATEASSTTVIGQNEALVAGAHALLIGRFDEGIRLTLDGLKLEKGRRDRAKGLSNLCAGYLGRREHAEALVACDQALVLNQYIWSIYNNRALALLGLGRVEEARSDFESAVALNPDAPKLIQTRAWIEAREPRTVLAAAPAPGARRKTDPDELAQPLNSPGK